MEWSVEFSLQRLPLALKQLYNHGFHLSADLDISDDLNFSEDLDFHAALDLIAALDLSADLDLHDGEGLSTRKRDSKVHPLLSGSIRTQI